MIGSSYLEALQPPPAPPVRAGGAPPIIGSPFAPKPPVPPPTFPTARHLTRAPRVEPPPQLLAKIGALVPAPSVKELDAIRQGHAESMRLWREEIKYSVPAAETAYYDQDRMIADAIGKGQPPPIKRNFQDVAMDFSSKRETAHHQRTKVMEETWQRVTVPIMQRYIAASKKLVPDLPKAGQAVVDQWGVPNPAAMWCAAIDELPAWLSWTTNAGTPPQKLPWLGVWFMK